MQPAGYRRERTLYRASTPPAAVAAMEPAGYRRERGS
jgi:hypothetical protein